MSHLVSYIVKPYYLQYELTQIFSFYLFRTFQEQADITPLLKTILSSLTINKIQHRNLILEKQISKF